MSGYNNNRQQIIDFKSCYAARSKNQGHPLNLMDVPSCPRPTRVAYLRKWRPNNTP